MLTGCVELPEGVELGLGLGLGLGTKGDEELEELTKGAEELEGLRPNGQKSPPLGGRTHTRESPSPILTKLVCKLAFLVVCGSTMYGAAAGTASPTVQLGPRALMKEVLPSKVFD